MEPSALARIIEAALLAAQRPLSLAQLAELFADEPAVTRDDIARAIDTLRNDCGERGVELLEVASGWRYQVRASVQPWVARLWAERQAKYTRATLETLALIAYRQPITRGEIEQVRGVAVNTNTIKTLEDREWIRVVGHRDVPGKPALYGTTRSFLDYFGLRSLDQLPPLAEIGEIPDIDPQLPFEAAPTVAIIEMSGDDSAIDGGEGDAMPAIASASEDAPADDPETTTVDATIDATTNPSREIAPEPHHD
ncbi:MAG: SMC-Scp complex subunit ScpB [Proteobacteria bacterium]|nr:SMC-Scp complex subunit ScpB [Pseudomonadota bacterium]